MGFRYTVYKTIHKCPHCGEEYDYTSTSTFLGLGSRQPDAIYYLKKPFIKCKNCKTTFLDRRFNEWVTLNDEERKDFYCSYRIIPSLIIVIIFAFYNIMCMSFDSSGFIIGGIIITLIFLIPFLISLVTLLRNISIRVSKKYTKPIIESIDRCLSEEYLYELKKANYSLYKINHPSNYDNNIIQKLNSLIEKVNNNYTKETDIKINTDFINILTKALINNKKETDISEKDN